MPKKKKNVLLMVSGSVAAIKIPALVQLLLDSPLIELKVVCTSAALHFFDRKELPSSVPCLIDDDEWSSWSKKGDPVLHIELRKWADIGIVAPLSANTLAKMANGLSDNLLTCILRAWDFNRNPLYVAPAMNTQMWEHPFTSQQLAVIQGTLGVRVISPVAKLLACNEMGMGAMAEITTVTKTVLEYIENLYIKKKIVIH